MTTVTMEQLAALALEIADLRQRNAGLEHVNAAITVEMAELRAENDRLFEKLHAEDNDQGG